MNLTYRFLKTKYFPEINKKVIGRDRIVQALGTIGIPVFDFPMSGRGAYVRDVSDGQQYVFIKYNLESLLYHETIAYEGVHALCHVPGAKFLERRHNLQSEIFSLIFMMPLTILKRLNRIKGQLDAESYEYLMRRNDVNSRWGY